MRRQFKFRDNFENVLEMNIKVDINSKYINGGVTSLFTIVM